MADSFFTMETGTMWKWTSALLLAGFAVLGCSKETPSGGEGPAATAEGPLGIAECDAYIEKMTAFLDTLPAESRAAREPGFQAMKAAWKETAKLPAAKENLAATCKAQMASLPASATK